MDAIFAQAQPLLTEGKVFMDWAVAEAAQLEPLAALTCFELPVVSPALDSLAEQVQSAAGMDLLTIKYVLVMFLAYPFALVWSMVPGKFLKNLTSAAVGIYLAQWLFGPSWVNCLISALVAYGIMAVTAPLRFMDGMRHWVVFVFMMSYMTASHIYRLYVDYMGWTPDYTGPQMILTIKLTSMAWNYYDGVVCKKRLDAVATNKDLPRYKKSAAIGFLDRAIFALPDPIEYLGYCFHPTTFFAGPAFGLRHYQDSVSGAVFKGEKPSWANRIVAGFLNFLQGVVFMGAYVWTAANLSPAMLDTPESMAQTDALSVLKRIALLVVAQIGAVQCKYFFAWKVTEGSAVWAGFGWNSDPKSLSNWNAVEQVRPMEFESATSVQAFSRHWNIHTQQWLEWYVFRRVTKAGSLNLLATYAISAFWHGFYPGYYLFFLSVPLVSELDKRLRKAINPWFYADAEGNPSAKAVQPRKDRKDLAFVYTCICWVFVHAHMHVLAVAFRLLDLNASLAWWSSVHYVAHFVPLAGHVLVTLLWVVGLAGGPKQKDAAKPKKE